MSAALPLPAHAAMHPGPRLPFVLAVLLLLALQFGPLVGLLGFRLTGADRWTLVGLARDVLVAALVLFGLHAWLTGRRRWPASMRWALAIVLADLLFALLSSSTLFVVAFNLRRLVLVPLLFMALWCMPWTPRQVRALQKLLLASSVLVALLGLAERALPVSLWTTVLQVDGYNAANAVDRFGAIAFEDSGRFYSWDLEAWLQAPLRRMVSTYLEPTTLAAAMASALVLALAQGARGRPAAGAALLFAVCGVLTLSKGFVLFLPVLLAWRLLGLPSPRQALLCALLLVAAAWGASRLGFGAGAAALHVDGLLSALRYLAEGHLAGEGLGAAGNYTESDSDIGAESGLGNVIAQVGVAALLPLLWVGALAREVMTMAALRRDPGGPWLAGWLLFWLISYLLSASSLGAGGNALGFMLLALYIHPAARTTWR